MYIFNEKDSEDLLKLCNLFNKRRLSRLIKATDLVNLFSDILGMQTFLANLHYLAVDGTIVSLILLSNYKFSYSSQYSFIFLYTYYKF